MIILLKAQNIEKQLEWIGFMLSKEVLSKEIGF